MFTIALRGLWRNRRRTLLSLGVIAACALMLVLVDAFVGGSVHEFRDTVIDSTGHLQIGSLEYWSRSEEDPAVAMLHPGELSAVESVLAEDSEVASWSRSIDVSGLIGNRDRSTMMIGTTIDIARDGSQIRGVRLAEGDLITQEDAREILVGQGLADQLGVSPGDQINIAAFSLDGSLNAMTVRIAGIVRFFESEQDMFGAVIPLPLAQRLLKTEGVSRISVHLSEVRDLGEFEDLEIVRNRFHSLLSSTGTEILALRWDELVPSYEETKTFFDAIRLLARVGLAILAFFSILQIITLSFLERTREIGTLRAIGTRRGRILRMMLLEGSLLGVLGALVGTLGGCGLSSLVNVLGIAWQFPGASEPQAISMLLTPPAVIVPFILTFVTSLISVIYPASRGANTQVVDALRHV